MDRRWARPWFAATALCVAAGIVIQLFVSAAGTGFFGGSPLNRALNVFAFFTIQSNVIVGVACVLLVVNPERSSAVLAVFRLTGVVAITVTFVVFHVALSRLLDLDTWAQTANQLQHTAVPVLAAVGWLAFGPRGAVAGYAKLGQSMAISSHEHVLELGGLAVDPRCQGRGVGRGLVEAAVEDARARGARKLSLRVLGLNTGARRLYESCGFSVEGVLRAEFLLEGRFVDDVLMARHLVPPG